MSTDTSTAGATVSAASPDLPDVRKSVVVPCSPAEAFRVFVEHPMEWWPADHVFVRDRVAITLEARVGGRYFERGADGTEIAWGRILECETGRRLAMTWRVGPGWSPIDDDERASVIEVDFLPAGDGTAEVVLTHAQLHRHGEIAPFIHRALDGPSPGDTLAQFAGVVERRAQRP